MARVLPLTLVCLAFSLLVFSVVGSDGYSRFVSFREHLNYQRRQNDELLHQVQTIESKLDQIKNDPRALEKAARSELGMAKPDELIFIFEV